jgi:hypothetical protein
MKKEDLGATKAMLPTYQLLYKITLIDPVLFLLIIISLTRHYNSRF